MMMNSYTIVERTCLETLVHMNVLRSVAVVQSSIQSDKHIALRHTQIQKEFV